MSAGCVRWMLCLAARNGLVHCTPASRLTSCSGRHNVAGASWSWRPYATETPDAEPTPEPKKKKPAAHRADVAIGSVGRKIPHRQLQVVSEDGEDLGTMHRADVLRLMDEKDLKLVLLRENKDPPLYQLMSGKQIHEERLKQRETKKAKAAPVQTKELSFSAGIAPHDRSTKLKQVKSWLEKKHHVRVTLRSGRGEPAGNVVSNLEQMVEQMEVTIGFVAKPQAIRDGQAAMCILRPPSAKELAQMNKAAKSQTAAPAKTSDTTGDSIQQ